MQSYNRYLDRVLNESTATNSILKQLEEYKATGDHIRDVSRNHDGYQFNVKVMRINIPDSVREKLSEDRINELVKDYTEDILDSFMKSLKGQYKWIGDIGLAGRSGGWLVMSDDDAIYSTIDDGRHDDDEEKEIIKTAKSRLSDLEEIDERVKKEKSEYIKTLQSKDVWKDWMGHHGK